MLLYDVSYFCVFYYGNVVVPCVSMYRDVIESEVEQLDSKLLLCCYMCNTEGIGSISIYIFFKIQNINHSIFPLVVTLWL